MVEDTDGRMCSDVGDLESLGRGQKMASGEDVSVRKLLNIGFHTKMNFGFRRLSYGFEIDSHDAEEIPEGRPQPSDRGSGR